MSLSPVSAPQLFLGPDGPLLVDGLHHGEGVGGQHVVHLVAEGGLAEQLGPAHQVAYRHVEVGVAAGPVGDLVEGVRRQDLLGVPIDQADSLLADGDEQQLWIVLVGALLHLEEGAAKGGQLEELLEELHLSFLPVDARVLVMRLVDLLLPLGDLERGDLVLWQQLWQQTLGQQRQLLLALTKPVFD